MHGESGMGKPIAVVTGGTRGIGLGITESLLKRGFSVAITYRENETAGQRAGEHLGRFLERGQKIIC